MFSKKLVIWIFSILFVVIVLISTVFAFTLNKIDTEYTLIGDDDSKSIEIDEKLNSFLGKNLLFLNKKDIQTKINENPYTECLSVEKNFPDTITVKVRERRDVYLIEFDSEYYKTDENAFVLSSYSGSVTRNLIEFIFEGVTTSKPIPGQVLSLVGYQDILSSALKVAKSINLTDCVKKIKLIKTFSEPLLSFDLELYTYTGTTIIVKKFNDDGEKKAADAFAAYNSETSEYKKSFYYFEAYKTDGGEIKVIWTTEK